MFSELRKPADEGSSYLEQVVEIVIAPVSWYIFVSVVWNDFGAN